MILIAVALFHQKETTMTYRTMHDTKPFRPGLVTRHRKLALLLNLLWLLALGVWAGAFSPSWPAPVTAAQGEQDARPLELGKPIERELAGGQSHAYQITLAEGQYLNVIVEQRGIDVVVDLFGPDGKQIMEFDDEIRNQGQETVSQVAKIAGSYRLNVQAKEKGAPAGRYEVRVMELRAATEKDRALQEARRLSAEFLGLYRARKYDEARPLVEHALEIREKALGPEHPAVAVSLNNLANLYHNKGDYTRAEPLHQRALGIREKTLGPEHPNVAASLNNLANLYHDKGDYAKGELLHQRALAIREKSLGPEHPAVAVSLNNLANLYRAKGDYARAEPLFQRVLPIWEKALGPEHPNVAASLNNLASLYSNKGDYARAEPLFQRALGIREKTLGPDHPDVAVSLNNLANLYHNKGDYTRAEPLFQRALPIWEKALGPEHSNLATSILNLAGLYISKGDYTSAEPLHQRALTILEKTLGPEHPSVALSLNNLALLYYSKGNYAKAEPLHQRALIILEKTLGPDHPDVALSLNNLALLYYSKGNYARAEPLYQSALAIKEKALGPEHLAVATSLRNLARLYAAKGNATQAVAFQSRANTVSERNIVLNLATGSERQKLAYLALFSGQTHQTLSLHVQSAPDDLQALHLALTTLLQRKGRSLDAMTDIIAPLRRRASPQDQALFGQFADVLSQLASLTFRGPGAANPAAYRAQLQQLEERREKLEADLSIRSAEFREQLQPITLATVQAAIPKGAALVEFALYVPFDVKSRSSGPSRYVAYVLPSQGKPLWVDLGEAAIIDRAVAALRQTLRDPSRTDVKTLARALDEKVMQPVRKLLGETRTVLLSPDGALHLLPFAALVDERERYLVERYSFSYLTSGRDLLRLQSRLPAKPEPVIVADPVFGERAGVTLAQRRDVEIRPDPQPSATHSIGLDRIYFPQLPATAGEAQAIKTILPQATVFTREQATEAALKQISSPRILHVATHGFFLQDIETKLADTRDVVLLGDGPTGLPVGFGGAQLENPLLRSGLALTGANLRQSGPNQEDDGVLTAMEVAGLDLWGTKLVVLSACDTGVGEVKNGEGVYGLRRALVLAGSETQVMSLWPVSDAGTRDLMIEYYKALQRGEGRAEALRQVQLRMLKRKDRSHPFYWASFIQSGEWANLEGKR